MIASAKVSAFCHLSENPKKVETAFLAVMPPAVHAAFSRQDTEGYFGNKIIIFSKELSRIAAAKFAAYLHEKLSEDDRHMLLSEAKNRLDGSTLFFRLDKQKAFAGELALTEGSDAVSVSISIATFPRDEKKIMQELAQLFK